MLVDVVKRDLGDFTLKMKNMRQRNNTRVVLKSGVKAGLRPVNQEHVNNAVKEPLPNVVRSGNLNAPHPTAAIDRDKGTLRRPVVHGDALPRHSAIVGRMNNTLV